ncbi:hypothetical protein HMPREF9062_1284 [Actinomyces sp. oral taxon 448 str. F0400]|nr:hypothetical protein HMPREF9062_1284 [Actinomyces sp. oral taxon 448 str. F0400]
MRASVPIPPVLQRVRPTMVWTRFRDPSTIWPPRPLHLEGPPLITVWIQSPAKPISPPTPTAEPIPPKTPPPTEPTQPTTPAPPTTPANRQARPTPTPPPTTGRTATIPTPTATARRTIPTRGITTHPMAPIARPPITARMAVPLRGVREAQSRRLLTAPSIPTRFLHLHRIRDTPLTTIRR